MPRSAPPSERPTPLVHARSRTFAVAAVGVAAALSTGVPALPEASPEGIARALGAASDGVVASDAFIWAPSRGAFLDATWGREVTFLARAAAASEEAPRDVLRARVAVSPGGRPLRVQSVARVTSTPLADEHSLVARGDLFAWVTRGTGGEHGATLGRRGSLPWNGWREGASSGIALVDVVLAKPADSLDIELRDEGLVLAIRSGEDAGRALLARDSLELTRSGSWTDATLLRRSSPHPEVEWRKDSHAPRRPEPPILDAPIDVTLFPATLPWKAVATPKVLVPTDSPAPAPVVRAVVTEGRARVILTGFDMRQLALRVVPAPSAPQALSGLPGTGRLAAGEVPSLVASAAVFPVAAAQPGAMERGRTIAPLALAAPRIGATEDGTPNFVGSESLVPYGVVRTADPADDEPVAAWCATDAGALVVAVAEPRTKAPIEAALSQLSCRTRVWVADGRVDAEPRLEDARARDFVPFAAFLHASSFPAGRPEAWAASPGRQPSPAFRAGVLEREEHVLGARVRVVAFVRDRFAWAIRAGTKERSHRAGGVFPSELEAPLVASAIAAIDLGIGERRRPNGLTIGGSTGHAYASRGAVLAVGERGLVLLPSAAVRDDPRGDAVELPLTATGGTPTPRALTRGLTQTRGDVCVLPDGTTLVALARFDSHAATAEALCRLGCSEVAALDRGLDVVPTLGRATADALPAAHPTTRLVALERGSTMTP